MIRTNTLSPSEILSTDDPTMLDQLRERFPDRTQILDPGNWNDIYVIGDIHGCANEFLSMIECLGFEDTDLLVCAGDVIGKGPRSNSVVEIIQNTPNILSVIGNFELDFLNDSEGSIDLSSHQENFMSTWPLVIGWEGNIVLHGGIDPSKTIADHTEQDLVTMRSPSRDNRYERPFWFEQYDGEERIFFGHTVTSEPFCFGNAVALDTGCVYGGKLTVFDSRSEEFVSLDAEKTYVERSSDRYADRILSSS